MKIFWVGTAYPEAVEKIFRDMAYGEKNKFSYQKIKASIDASYTNYFATGWCKALENIGYETENVVVNVAPLQQQWIKEYGVRRKDLSLEEILLLQIKKYRPNIVFVADCCNENLIRHIRNEVPSVRLIIGWAGSAVAKDVTKKRLWKMLDVILCCAPESVAVLRQEGGRAIHMNHAFPREVLPLLSNHKIKRSSISFVGSLIRGDDYHLNREALLLGLANILPLEMYSPSVNVSKKQLLKSMVGIGLYNVMQLFPKKVKDDILSSLPIVGKTCKRRQPPLFPINIDLYRHLRQPVFGIEMFETLFHSDVVLNIHADSSPEFASNMRLYEATGVGSCLLTDNKKNMNDLFTPGKEVVTYDSVQDCVEKATWLMEHPAERQKIAEAGKHRCLREHTYDIRAYEFDQMIKRVD